MGDSSLESQVELTDEANDLNLGRSKRANATRRRHPSTVFPDLTVNTISEKEKSKAELVVLASDVNSAEYKALVTAITKEGKTALINVDSKEILGTWCGLSKIDEEGEVVKARACGCVGLKSIPNNDAGNKVKAFIQTNQA